MFNANALAFCAIIDRHLVHITLIALCEDAKKKVESWPMKINWDI